MRFSEPQRMCEQLLLFRVFIVFFWCFDFAFFFVFFSVYFLHVLCVVAFLQFVWFCNCFCFIVLFLFVIVLFLPLHYLLVPAGQGSLIGNNCIAPFLSIERLKSNFPGPQEITSKIWVAKDASHRNSGPKFLVFFKAGSRRSSFFHFFRVIFSFFRIFFVVVLFLRWGPVFFLFLSCSSSPFALGSCLDQRTRNRMSRILYSCKNALQTCLVVILKNLGWRSVATHQTRHGNQKKTKGETKNNIHKQ